MYPFLYNGRVFPVNPAEDAITCSASKARFLAEDNLRYRYVAYSALVDVVTEHGILSDVLINVARLCPVTGLNIP